jgi:hypothetical protein
MGHGRSEKIHCDHCVHITNKNKTVYYHSMMAKAIIKPSSPVVVPLEPELIQNEDDREKQDCERNAATRYLDRNAEGLRGLKPTFSGDDLYACHSICTKILKMGMSFLKRRGYNLAHNFGHGQNHAADIYCLLNILGFLFHSIQDAVDEDYQAARKSFGRRDGFFWGLGYEISRYLHDDWSLFFLTVAGQAPDG